MSITSAAYERVSDSRVAKLLPRGGFGRHVAVLAGGSVLAQGLTVVAAPLLTRLYTPQEFGVLAAFAVLYGPLSVMISWRYEAAIPLPKDEPTATNLLALTAVVALGMACLVGGAVWLGARQIAAALRVDVLAHYLWILPITLLATGLYEALIHWGLRKGSFRDIAKARINRSFALVAFQSLFGLLHFHGAGLLLGEALGQAGGGRALTRLLRAKGRPKLEWVSLAGMREAARRYVQFPLIATPTSILNIVGMSTALVFLTRYFGPAQAGLFLLGQRLAASPLRLIGNSISQVFYSDLASHKDDYHRNLRRFQKLSGYLGGTGLLAASVLLTAPCWAEPLFGPRWAQLGWLMAALVPLLVARLVASSLAHAYYVYSKQHLLLILECARLGVIIASFSVGAIVGLGFLLTVSLFSFSTALLYFVYWLVIFSLLRARRNSS